MYSLFKKEISGFFGSLTRLPGDGGFFCWPTVCSFGFFLEITIFWKAVMPVSTGCFHWPLGCTCFWCQPLPCAFLLKKNEWGTLELLVTPPIVDP